MSDDANRTTGEAKKYPDIPLDSQGRITELKLYNLMGLCQKTLDSMKEKGKSGTDNYMFFLDMWNALGQCIYETQEAERYRSAYTFQQELNQLLSSRIGKLEQELSGYRVVEELLENDKLDVLLNRVRESMKRQKVRLQKLNDES